MAHLAIGTRGSAAYDPIKGLVGRHVIWGYDSDPAGTGTITYFPAKIEGIEKPKPEFIERKVYNPTSKVDEVDMSIAKSTDPVVITLVLEDVRSPAQLALLNNNGAFYGENVIWIGDPRDISTKCAMVTNVFSATGNANGFDVPNDTAASFKVELKVTGLKSPATVLWVADQTIA